MAHGERKGKVEAVFFDLDDTEVKARFLGLLVGHGASILTGTYHSQQLIIKQKIIRGYDKCKTVLCR